MAFTGPTLTITLEFGGGLDLLFSSIPTRSLTLPKFYDPLTLTLEPVPQQSPNPKQGKAIDLKYLIWYLKNYLLDDKERVELFSLGESIRPGILILINSTDWELEGELEYELEDKDEIVFISTLHGG